MRVSIGLVAVSALMFSACTGGYDYDVPLDPDSPWPKFRRTARQDGRSPVVLEAEEGAEPWVSQRSSTRRPSPWTLTENWHV